MPLDIIAEMLAGQKQYLSTAGFPYFSYSGQTGCRMPRQITGLVLGEENSTAENDFKSRDLQALMHQFDAEENLFGTDVWTLNMEIGKIRK